ncbi:MAG: alpha/beta fold hydrolase [Polaribacter sp.]|nr:alpha/beta fold hydrolase [Polaribacter sp.]
MKNTVLSDGHPMAVWEKKADNAKGLILFVHGRTWSGVPDFDLQVEGEDLSLMDGMAEQGYTTYAVDLRGYGGTPRDSTEWNSPDKAAKDILNILNWISVENENRKVHLFGWSMGSTLSLLATQKNATDIASLTLFGFWKDLDIKFPETPNIQLHKSINTAENAASDFITSGSISQKAIDTYVKMALEYDPIRVDWRNLSEYNSIDPSLITTPVLILQGEFDPIAPTERQAKLFTRLKTADKSWIVISGGDHAAFMEKPRKHFIHSFTQFINRFDPL